MNFWEAQRSAKTRTTIYLFIFGALTILAAALAEYTMRAFASENYGNPEIPFVALGFLALVFGVAGFNYVNYLQSGGPYVAESVGGRLIQRDTRNLKERQLLNIVEEIAIATSLPVPPVYLINAKEINAFAAGTSPSNAAIAVTVGTLNLLNRDELQGVLAHEFGHIYHGDMKIGMRVAAMVMGFFIASYIGLRLLGNSGYGYRSRRDEGEGKGGNPVVVIALIFLAIGAVMWFFGSILQAMVSRQREFLADASSVQFTRNPEGIASALKKIDKSQVSDMPRDGKPFAHLYFNEHPSFWSRIFATHPPIEERITAIEGGEYTDFSKNEPPLPPLPPNNDL
ncbi:MAG: M48 family metallopeptidase [Parachlamydiaceae bacterium]|nr:M48 family metallopeptidase [Parachlamydiaceae bacterium]